MIPDEQIAGLLLLVCGGSDRVWVSCSFAEAIVDRLERHHDRYTHQLLEYPEPDTVSGLSCRTSR